MSEIRLEKLEELTRDSVATDKLAMVVSDGNGNASDTAAVRTALGLGSIATQDAAWVDVTDYGAVGDGDSGNAATNDAAFAAALATGNSVYVPPGHYYLSATIVHSMRGQKIFGVSTTITVLEWTTDVDGIRIDPHSNATYDPNNPGGITDQNTRWILEGLFLKGPSGSTKDGFSIAPRTGGANDWNGTLGTLRNVHAERWAVGFDCQYASKVEFDNCLAKSCTSYGFYLHDTTNNCHHGFRVSATDCTVGMRLEGIRGGVFTLGDFGDCATGIECADGNATFIGGELESFTSTFFDFNAGYWTVLGARFLPGTVSTVSITAAARASNVVTCTAVNHGLEVGDRVIVASIGFSGDDPNGSFIVTTTADDDTFTYASAGSNETFTVGSATMKRVLPAIVGRGRCSISVSNCDYSDASQFATDGFLARMAAATAVICGLPGPAFLYANKTANTAAAGRFQDYQGNIRSIGQFPVVPPDTNVSSLMSGLVYVELSATSYRAGDQLVMVSKDGSGNANKIYLGGDNNLIRSTANASGGPIGWEDVFRFTSTSAKTCNLIATTDPDMRATSTNGKRITLVNAAATGDVTVNANGSDTIDGGASATISPNSSLTLLTFGDGEWYSV